MGPRRQLDLIGVTAELGGPERKAVRVEDIARQLNLSVSTIAGAPGFLTQAGLLAPGRGAWAVTEAGATLAALRRQESIRARLFLHGHWQGTWFQQDAARLLAGGPMEEGDLAGGLGKGSPGVPERGLYLVEWLCYALIVHRDNHGRIALFVGTTPSFSDAGPGPSTRRPGSDTCPGPTGKGPTVPRARTENPSTSDTACSTLGGPVFADTDPFAARAMPGPDLAPSAQVVLDPLMAGSVEEISALPGDRFVALMKAYQAFYTSLPPAIRPVGT
ncbi:hypothetical protein ACIQBJ_25295 [Kitasatospora sp. NPDC088391]|uniref:hypothetical protein n=1 Tax=Kitasatospora sp. NPDC088391 TaxID=3364074 RepID=UPI003816358F